MKMWFKYNDEFYVEECDLETMKKEVRAGQNPEEVYEDWAAGLDDCDYYRVDNVKDKILEEITKILDKPDKTKG